VEEAMSHGLGRLVRLLLVPVMTVALSSTARSQDSVHLKMGNPSKAKPDETKKSNFLMVKREYALSYNDDLGTPNWVSWQLTADHLGMAGRKPFRPDPDLPSSFDRITPSDYTGSGFDRGPMCPHNDRAKDSRSSAATFVMTNMVPQSPNNNQKAWNQLEIYCRELVKSGKVCYIIAGPQGRGGTGRNGFKVTTPDGNVVVPNKTWKVIMVLDEDVDDPSTITEDAEIRLIAVIMPNDQSVGQDWSQFRTSVKDVERLTRLKFFDKVPAAVINPLKGQEDDVPIPSPEPVHHPND